MTDVTCSDNQCKHNLAGQCVSPAISHTSDRFCSTGRRRPRDDTAELMQPSFKAGCRPTQSGYKADHGRVLK